MNIEKTELESILDNFRNKDILVIGDLMLDHYIFGTVDRISPEAPVPVVNVKNEEFRLGGSANVANNINTLGANPMPVGVIGNDQMGEKVAQLFKDMHISTKGLLRIDNRPTTQKTRLMAHQQQVARIDFEETEDISDKLVDEIIAIIKKEIDNVDGIVIQDYNKGLLTKNLITQVISIANKNGKLITVDPKRKNFFSYKNVTVFKPNLSEFRYNMNIISDDKEEFINGGMDLMKRINCQHLVITQGKEGMTIFEKDNTYFQIPTFAQQVYDVSGAGDTVISTLTLSLAANCSIRKSAIIANHAASVVCGKLGIQPVYPDEIVNSFQSGIHLVSPDISGLMR